ncbi:MAG TPA: ribonuclease HII, partial [Candidatus Yanofskybacteria bacterium]|nr:ribonuclease HII [Candidatus Yanofskybacteria bacterium]
VQRRPLQVIALVDGPHRIPNLRIDQRAIIKGDQKVFVIACASIIAKVYRDKMMAKYAIKYPNYGFEIHKGYGTKQHYAQLASIGPCAIHRKSFRLI